MDFLHAKKKPRLADELCLMDVRISNLPKGATSRSLNLFLSFRLGNDINFLECMIQQNSGYARITLASKNQARQILSLHGTCFEGHELQIQSWESNFIFPPPLLPQTIPAEQLHDVAQNGSGLDVKSVSSSSTASSLVYGSLFTIEREDCAVFVRNIPCGVSAEDLKQFLQKRIQLAFKELMAEIHVQNCYVFKAGTQACVEFQHRRHAIRALSLRNKTLHGHSLDILQWENRRWQSWMEGDEAGMLQEERSGNTRPGRSLLQAEDAFAVYVNQLPERTTSKKLIKYFTEAMEGECKKFPVVRHCSVRSSRNDAHVEFHSHEFMKQALNLHNRPFDGQRINIIPWDPTFKILDYDDPDRAENAGAADNFAGASKQTTTRKDSTMLEQAINVAEPTLTQAQLLPISFSDHENKNHEQPLVDVGQESNNTAVCDEPRMMNMFKRQLDAIRLDRDHWKTAHHQCQQNLKEITSELASTRARFQPPIQQNSKVMQSDNLSCQTENTLQEMQKYLSSIAESLSRQTNALNSIVQENFSLKAQLKATTEHGTKQTS